MEWLEKTIKNKIKRPGEYVRGKDEVRRRRRVNTTKRNKDKYYHVYD
jgi:hypothetical protein